MLYRFSLAVIFSVLSVSLWAEDPLLQTFYKLPTNITVVKQVCPWKSATAQGTIRLMQFEEKGAHRLYVQWLRQGIAGSDTTAISTVPIKELNGLQYYRFDLPNGKLLKGACAIETIMENIIDERRFKMTLYIKGAGKYEYHISRLLDGDL